MILQLTASSDTYITNKIINNSFSASDANVGRAGTIDLFKLYNESSFTGLAETSPVLSATLTLRKNKDLRMGMRTLLLMLQI